MLNTSKTFFTALILVFFVACGSSNDPESLTKDFLSEIAEGKFDIEKMYLGKDVKDDGTKEMFTGKLKAFAQNSKAQTDKKGGLKEVKILSSKVEENKAFVDFEILFNDGSSNKGKARLVKDNQTWKIEKI
ncbi:hypothetical protein DMB92_06555 [Campylobacter sp. MIT 99-7217]|uniref:DUF4878 domain-containing protein n=1 Tax=Campylobacter sp. MIT 99-7217 TaxID=535091 RepID=UPI00115B5BE8|nr:DUF4878 domain-containing protein [Campylobacter sp. MIT 99-7217]TQR31344.1 hypothetical protein DMB92_06555 [Campylobacter sp. MIT 99-7217]